jgi:hypothetical protein
MVDGYSFQSSPIQLCLSTLLRIDLSKLNNVGATIALARSLKLLQLKMLEYEE